MNQSQIAIDVEVPPEEVARKKTLGEAITLCAELAGFTLDKELSQGLGVDKAQFSRWHSGAEGIVWPKLRRLMDFCGNDAPVLWMAYQLGYDLSAMRKRETELQRENRELRDQIKALRCALRD